MCIAWFINFKLLKSENTTSTLICLNRRLSCYGGFWSSWLIPYTLYTSGWSNRVKVFLVLYEIAHFTKFWKFKQNEGTKYWYYTHLLLSNSYHIYKHWVINHAKAQQVIYTWSQLLIDWHQIPYLKRENLCLRIPNVHPTSFLIAFNHSGNLMVW